MSATLLPTIAAIVPCLLIIRINGNMNDNPLSRLKNLHMSTPNWLAGSGGGIQINVTQHQTSELSVREPGPATHGSGIFSPSSKAKEVAGAESTDEDSVEGEDMGVDDVEKQQRKVTATTMNSDMTSPRRVQYMLPPPPPASAMPQGFGASGEYVEMQTRR